MLARLRRERASMAVVFYEFGGTAGVVTLEDLVEEIVGEIRDEYDVETEAVVDDGQGGFVVSGRADIEDVADRLGVEIEGEGFETVGGYLLSHLGRVPAVGETFEVGGLTVEVLEAERRRIHKVRARRTQAVAQQD
jgi:magnesium and cobalt transporter